MQGQFLRHPSCWTTKDILKNSNVSVIREANGKKSCKILTLVLGMVGASLQGPP